MSAARIREAAKVLRDAAEGATGDEWGVVGAQGLAISPSRFSSAVIASATTKADAAYIALMSPPVALALADWLDAIEVLWSSAESMHDADGDPLTFGESIDSHALTLANTILGDRS